MQLNGVDVYIHWSVFLIAAIVLAASVRKPVVTLVGLVCYLSVLLIHETGHMIAAQRLGCRVNCIMLYPIHGLCSFQRPWSRFDHCIIAWGGVIAQAIVFLPLLGFIGLFGYTRYGSINAILAILGGFSMLTAFYNLLPLGRLDGTVAWDLIPEWIRRIRSRRKQKSVKRATDWRTY